MLVLSRKTEEAIVIPSLGIRILITEIRKGVVKIGVEAPRDVKVLREELLEQKAA